MTEISRRRLITTGVVAAGSLTGLAAAGRIAKRYGLIPPDHGGCYGAGETLTYATQRILTGDRAVREFPRSMISKAPFANEVDPPTAEFKKLHAGGFSDWRLVVDGMVDHPLCLSLADLRSMPMRSQITEIGCEEGWTYIAEWIGTPLNEVLKEAGLHPNVRFIFYRSMDKMGWWESIDMADAMHPQTFLAMGMNDGDLPIGFGGPLRMRLPRQLGYKSLKYVVHLTATDSMKRFGKGLGSIDPEGGYSWYAGI